MAGLFDTFTISKRGLSVQQGNINTSAHNITNASTVGYSRQETVIKTTKPFGGNGKFDTCVAGQVGTGAEISTIQRVRSEFVDYQVREANGILANSQAKADLLSKVQDILGETSDEGIQGLVTQLYKSVQSLTSSPEKSDIKSVVIQNALSLTDSLNYTYKQLEKQVDNAQDILMDNTVTINDCLDQVNELNKQIRKVTTLGQSPNDLMDSRDVLLDELSSKFGVNLNKKSLNGIDVNSDEYNNLKLVNSDSNDFNYNRFSTVKSATIENGKLTVEYYKLGNQNSEAESFTISGNENTLNQLKSQFEQCRILIADKDGNIDKSLDGSTVDSDGGKAVKGVIFQTYAYEPGVNNVSTSNDKIRGEVAGNQSVQATIKSYMEDLDKLAASIAYSINAVQTGTTSDDLSNGVSQDLIFVAKNDGGVKTDSHISASNITVNTDVLNDPTKLNSKPSNESGSGANDRSQSMATLLTTLKFDFGSISNGSTEWNRDGFLSDSKVNFDSSDGTAEKNINLAGKTTGSTLINYYSSLINKMGNELKSTENLVSNQKTVHMALENQRVSESGVSLDEEMTNLIEFQHAYQANAKVISTVDQLLDVVINGLSR